MLTTNTSQDNRWTALDHRTSQDTQEGTHFHIKRSTYDSTAHIHASI